MCQKKAGYDNPTNCLNQQETLKRQINKIKKLATVLVAKAYSAVAKTLVMLVIVVVTRQRFAFRFTALRRKQMQKVNLQINIILLKKRQNIPLKCKYTQTNTLKKIIKSILMFALSHRSNAVFIVKKQQPSRERMARSSSEQEFGILAQKSTHSPNNEAIFHCTGGNNKWPE